MSLIFTGAVTDRVVIGSGVSIDNLSPMTVLAWVYPTALTNNRCFYYKGAAALRRMFRLSGTTGDIQFAGQRTTLTNYVTNSTPLSVINRWYLVAATFDTGAGAGEVVNLYTGTLTALASEATYGTATDGTGAATDDAADNGVWGNTANNDSAFSGWIAYGALFNRVLPLAEIHRWQRAPRMLAGCVDFHRFGGVQGTGIQRDLSGFGNHGVVTGAVPGPEIPLGLVRQSMRRRLMVDAVAAQVVRRPMVPHMPQAVRRLAFY